MTQQPQYRIELFIKIAGPLLVLAGLVFGVVEFRNTVKTDRDNRNAQYTQTLAEAQREAKKPFYEQQLALYLEATNVTSRISIPLSESDKKAAIVRFRQLYWGQLALVENREVAQAMIDFKEVLENTELSEKAMKVQLKRKTINLARKCRDSLKESWDIKLTDFDAKE